ncbi:hypothetical protein V5O48_003963 [Marasmius crinis-equi]|uniref:Protein kinase domain-containing protein n=1 Tax=Marasmius crinis-equi TaxID=585013 RepID=A0ABR3FS90_9AGAR
MPSALSTSRAAGSLQKSSPFIGAVEDSWEMYSDTPSDYNIGSPIGFGASSIVYAADYQPRDRLPPPIPCALKVLDLDSLRPRSLALLQRETTLMSLSKHPNVIRVRGSWMDGHKLYIAMRLMNKGSAADVMRYGWQGGLEEDVIKCILKQALEGLNYLHINGFIHRDVKAANLLVDDDGTVLLGDLGVAADLSEDTSAHMNTPTLNGYKSSPEATPSSGEKPSGSKRVVVVEPEIAVQPKIAKRKSFVGTPCWMAPELIMGKQYDSSADIWSFGITALELGMGRPPRSRDSSQKVLLRIVQEDPPSLDREGGEHKYSKAFQEMVESCLVKDPSKRPTAKQLLQSSFFKGTKKPSYLITKILKDLPPLAQRQERRVLPNSQTHRSIDSWDFATTLHSPPISIPTKRFSEEFGVATPGKGPFASDSSHDRDGSSSRTHSRAVSLAGQPVIEDEGEIADRQEPLSSSPPSDKDLVSASPGTSSYSQRTPPSSSSGVSGQSSPDSSSAKSDTKPSGSEKTSRRFSRLSSSPSQGGGIWAKIKTVTSSSAKRVSANGSGTK